MNVVSRIEQLTHLLLSGDPRAFAEFYELCDPSIRRGARSGGAHGEDLEDAVQEAWIKLVARLNRIRVRSNFLGYIWRIGRNAARDLFRRRRSVADANRKMNEFPTPPTQLQETPLESLIRNETAQLVQETLQAMANAGQRQLLHEEMYELQSEEPSDSRRHRRATAERNFRRLWNKRVRKAGPYIAVLLVVGSLFVGTLAASTGLKGDPVIGTSRGMLLAARQCIRFNRPLLAARQCRSCDTARQC